MKSLRKDESLFMTCLCALTSFAIKGIGGIGALSGILLVVILFSTNVPLSCGKTGLTGNPPLRCLKDISRKSGGLDKNAPCIEELVELYENINEDNYKNQAGKPMSLAVG